MKLKLSVLIFVFMIVIGSGCYTLRSRNQRKKAYGFHQLHSSKVELFHDFSSSEDELDIGLVNNTYNSGARNKVKSK